MMMILTNWCLATELSQISDKFFPACSSCATAASWQRAPLRFMISPGCSTQDNIGRIG